MSPKRRPIEPPELAGYRYLQRLGAGGFADVFLYEREFPRQHVAIKVLDRLVGGGEGQERFTAEANAMASLSTHPYIVTIFHADISPEGHPYLVMEYYPGDNYSIRSKAERFSLAQILRLGIQVASAIETAHQAEILHRDVKPANVLTSAYGRPGLTDFGIAASRDSTMFAAEGLSIPWSPPEALSGESTADARSDVYSLAATLFTVAEGHSPFERPGESNRSIDLINRIEHEPVPSFDRKDLPGSLLRLLAQAMAKNPWQRPASAADFGRGLQTIEIEQRFDLTSFEVTEEASGPIGTRPIDAEAGSTRIKGPTVVEGQSRGPSVSDTVSRQAPVAARPPASSTPPIRGIPFAVPEPPRATPQVRGPQSAPSATTQPVVVSYQPPSSEIPEAPPLQPEHRRRLSKGALAVTIGALVAVVVVVAVLVLGTSHGPSPARSAGGTVGAKVQPPRITGWTSVTNTEGRVFWSSAGGRPGDTYVVVYGSTKLSYPGSSACGEDSSSGGYYCNVSPIKTPYKPITVYRVRSGTSSVAATSPET